RTQDAGHALLRQGRNPKVRKNSGVIDQAHDELADARHGQHAAQHLKPVQRSAGSRSHSR
ncbi:hypothetical protein, partial [Bifidobacterium adolescentis]|uniref:hypothetical protein n=1 Tax=Bifidobacterium adolescentis TaxID=1680 RepID=UPI0034A0F9E4